MKSFPSNIGRGLRTALSQISILRLDGASYRCLTGTRPGFFNEVLPICFQPCNAAPTQVKSKRTQSIWLRRLPKGREFGSTSLSTFVPLALGPRNTAKNKQGFLGQFSGWPPPVLWFVAQHPMSAFNCDLVVRTTPNCFARKS